jgi:hypothetical protein
MWNCQIGRLLWDGESIIFLKTQYSTHWGLCTNPNYMMSRENIDSQYKWTSVLLWLLWHMQNVCSCLSLHSFHKQSYVQWSKHSQIFVPHFTVKKKEAKFEKRIKSLHPLYSIFRFFRKSFHRVGINRAEDLHLIAQASLFITRWGVNQSHISSINFQKKILINVESKRVNTISSQQNH